MIVTAALNWWNEPPEVLARCVRGIATIADRIVAVDGAYRRYPGATVKSSEDQKAAIIEAAVDVGLAWEIYTPEELWAGQIEKRTRTLQLAAEGSDWVAQVDADWVASGDREAVRAELARTTHQVVSVNFCTPPADVDFSTNWHKRVSDTCIRYPHLYRALPDIRVEKRHWWISATYKGKRVWLYHPQRVTTRMPTLPQHQLQAEYRIDHLFSEHTEEQVRASRAFCNDRNKVVQLTGQEDHVPGLPDPVWDFDTIPY